MKCQMSTHCGWVAMTLLAGCSHDAAPPTCDPGVYQPTIVAADFSATIDNRYLSYPPGMVFRYKNSDGEIVEQQVLGQTRTLLGVPCTIVHDSARTADGQLLEDTYDYFAQDRTGNVWYFGEDTKAYAGTMVSTAGSWAAGQACARPGIVMKAQPQVGESYRQEYLPGEAEDEAEVVSVGETVTVPFGTFMNCVKTREHTALAPGDVENKFYCPGVGEVLSLDIGSIDQGKREELVSVTGKAAP
jgi:hypothetical protein